MFNVSGLEIHIFNEYILAPLRLSRKRAEVSPCGSVPVKEKTPPGSRGGFHSDVEFYNPSLSGDYLIESMGISGQRRVGISIYKKLHWLCQSQIRQRNPRVGIA